MSAMLLRSSVAPVARILAQLQEQWAYPQFQVHVSMRASRRSEGENETALASEMEKGLTAYASPLHGCKKRLE